MILETIRVEIKTIQLDIFTEDSREDVYVTYSAFNHHLGTVNISDFEDSLEVLSVTDLFGKSVDFTKEDVRYWVTELYNQNR